MRQLSEEEQEQSALYEDCSKHASPSPFALEYSNRLMCLVLKFFARQFSKKMEAAGELSEEQWGSRKDRNSIAIDAAMIKLLTFEAARA